MSAPLIIFIQVSCFLMQNALSQYPPMFGMSSMPGMPQVISYQIPIPYQSPLQSAQIYNTTIQSNRRHKSKNERKKTHRRHKHEKRDIGSSSESSSASSESEDSSSEECTCSLTCDQCSTVTSNCCSVFCSTCVNQGFILYPVSYPVVMTNRQPPKQEVKIVPKEKGGEKCDNAKEEKGEKNNNGTNSRRSNKLIVNTTVKPEEKTTKSSTELQNLTTKKEDITTNSPKEDILKSTKVYTNNVESSTENSRRILSNDHMARVLKRRVAKIAVRQNNENEIEASALKIMSDTRKNSIPPEHYFHDIIFKVPNKGDTKYILTSARRVKENWLPKYGLVPIPENVAAVLMTNFRSLESIQSVKEPHTISGPRKAVQPTGNQYNATSDDDAVRKTNSVSQESETIFVREPGSRSGMTIEGPLSAIQSLNRKIVETMQSEQNKANQKYDALPIDLIKKIYKY